MAQYMLKKRLQLQTETNSDDEECFRKSDYDDSSLFDSQQLESVQQLSSKLLSFVKAGLVEGAGEFDDTDGMVSDKQGNLTPSDMVAMNRTHQLQTVANHGKLTIGYDDFNGSGDKDHSMCDPYDFSDSTEAEQSMFNGAVRSRKPVDRLHYVNGGNRTQHVMADLQPTYTSQHAYRSRQNPHIDVNRSSPNDRYESFPEGVGKHPRLSGDHEVFNTTHLSSDRDDINSQTSICNGDSSVGVNGDKSHRDPINSFPRHHQNISGTGLARSRCESNSTKLSEQSPWGPPPAHNNVFNAQKLVSKRDSTKAHQHALLDTCHIKDEPLDNFGMDCPYAMLIPEDEIDLTAGKQGNKIEQVTSSGRNRGAGKSNEPRFECQICSDVAAGFHCGAYVCEACKKFYLRCLKSDATSGFVCPKNSDCEITKETRSHCQYCRYQKCVSLKMYKPGRDIEKQLKVDFKEISCKVCEAPSSGYHFGAITCEGCKGFFRRMLKEQLHRKFACGSHDNCDITKATRTTCKSCRFNKCVEVGMALKGTRLGRQSNSIKRMTLLDYQKMPFKDPVKEVPTLVTGLETEGPNAVCKGVGTDGGGRNSPDLWDAEKGEVGLALSEGGTVGSPDTGYCSGGKVEGTYESTSPISPNHRHSYSDQKTHPPARSSVVEYPSDNHGDDLFPAGESPRIPHVNGHHDVIDLRHNVPAGHHNAYRPYQNVHASYDNAPNCHYNYNESTDSASTLNRNSLSLQQNSDPQPIYGMANNADAVDYAPELPSHSTTSHHSHTTCGSHLPLNPVVPSQTPPSTEPETVISPQPSSNKPQKYVSFYKQPIEEVCSYFADLFLQLQTISQRPADMENLEASPLCPDTVWQIIDLSFMHHAKSIIKFVKNIPGVSMLDINDQMTLTRQSLYPISLTYHSQKYDLETKHYNWFINTEWERELILKTFPELTALGYHLATTGHLIKSLQLDVVEYSMLTALIVAAPGVLVPLENKKAIEEIEDSLLACLQDYLFYVKKSDPTRLGRILARLPELHRAALAHNIIAQELHMVRPSTHFSQLWNDIFPAI